MRSPGGEVCRFDGRTGWCAARGRTPVDCRGWKKALRPIVPAIGVELPGRPAKLAARGVATGPRP